MFTPLSTSAFRTMLPAFADTTAFPDSLVTIWLNLAPQFVNSRRVNTLAPLLMALWTAHQLTLESRSLAAASTGGDVGELTGPTASQAVDRVSVAYDTACGALQNAGDFGTTSYGVRYLKLARTCGGGGMVC